MLILIGLLFILPAVGAQTGVDVNIVWRIIAQSADAIIDAILRLTGKARHPSSAPRDQRTASTYIFGAVCPKEGKGAALIMPACNTEAMNLHFAEIAATVAPAARAILLVDQAGWHLSTRLLVPANITIIVLPPKCPELNPVENVWQTVCSFLDGGRGGSFTL
jgi:DDE superfamily endonuclease